MNYMKSARVMKTRKSRDKVSRVDEGGMSTGKTK